MSALPLVALVGNPNAGKSALFNALTGARQKTGNYPGVTVERHSGRFALADGRPVELVDLPGTYSLTPTSPDEAVTRDVVMGRQAGERRPAAIIIVVDACNLDSMACHQIDRKVVGPSYKEVAAKYAGQKDAEAKLVKKVREGGAGVWGQVPMPPNTTLTEKDALVLVKWILSQK